MLFEVTCVNPKRLSIGASFCFMELADLLHLRNEAQACQNAREPECLRKLGWISGLTPAVRKQK